MPKECFCNKCERFREEMPEPRATTETLTSLANRNVKREDSRRGLIRSGKTKSGRPKVK